MQRPRISENVIGSFVDAWRSLRDIPFLYFMMFAVIPGIMAFSLLNVIAITYFFPEIASLPEAGQMFQPHQPVVFFTLMFGSLTFSMVLLVPAYIGMTRYFTAGDKRYGYRFGRPFLRILGWGALGFVGMCALYAIPLSAHALNLYLSPENPAPGLAVTIALLALILSVGAWISIRMYTFFGALALDERSPVFWRCFQETRGFFWHIVLNYLAFIFATMVLQLALSMGGGIAVMLMTFLAAIIDSALYPYIPLPVFSFLMSAIAFVLLAIIALAVFGAQIALYGRLFRVIRSSGSRAPVSARQPPIPARPAFS